jgi:DNA-binding SARP family transcriptional activator
MEFRILGPLEVIADGRVVELGGQKRALLAMLLLEANRVVATERLIDVLWEDDPPETAVKAVQVYVSQLRKVLGRDRLETRPPGYRLRVEEGELDLDRFRLLEAEGKLVEALALWRGPPLAEVGQLRFAAVAAARLEELRVGCVERRLEHDLTLGRHQQLVGELEALVGEHPLRQRLRAQLMLALYRSGRDAEALDVYRDARTALVEELGIEPRRELRELQQAILNQDPALELSAEQASAIEQDRAAFFGRALELEELAKGLDEALAGHGRLFLLVGEPGIGKSRLADELMGRARTRGAGVLVGRCWEAGGAPAYWPWVQALRAHVRMTEREALRAELGAGAADLAQLLPELRELFADLPEPPALESESARFRLFEAVSSFLRTAARARPLVLVLDDLHAADEPSLLLLQFLARELGGARVLLFAAYRDVDPSPNNPLTAALTELAREPVTRILPLAGLREHEVAQFVEFISGEPPGEALVAAIHQETEGNPLFVGEIVRLLATEGRLGEREAPRLAIPQSVRDVIARRLRHLSEECYRVLLLASVLGREFRLEALSRLADVSETELLDTLDEAMTARAVSDVPGAPTVLRFAHVLIRDTLYEGTTTARRVRLHRLAVEALEGLYGDEPGQHLAELAHHAVAGSDFDRGLRYAQEAGDRALELFAYEEAARLYQTALDALELSQLHDENVRCELLLSLGDAESVGDRLAAKRTFLNAAIIARRLGLPHEFARAAGGYSGRIAWVRAGADGRLVPLLEEALAALADDDVTLRARLLARLSGALRDEPTRDRRDSLSAEAVALARRSGNPAALAYALEGRGAAIFAPDTVAEVLAIADELAEVAERIGDKERLGHGHFMRVAAHAMLGNLREAETALDAEARIADELRQPVQVFEAFAGRTMLALATGRISEAADLIPHALALGERAEPELAVPINRVHRYLLCELRGGLEELEPAMVDLAAEYPARPVFRCVLAHLRAALRRREEAQRDLTDLARDDFAALNFDLEWLLGMSLLAETSVLLGDVAAATTLYRLLLPWKKLNVADYPEGIRGSVSRYLGLLATATDHVEDGERHFEDALTINERMGARPWLALTQGDYARMLLERDARGDSDRGQELLHQALATYHELGMKSFAASASKLSASKAAHTPRGAPA